MEPARVRLRVERPDGAGAGVGVGAFLALVGLAGFEAGADAVEVARVALVEVFAAGFLTAAGILLVVVVLLLLLLLLLAEAAAAALLRVLRFGGILESALVSKGPNYGRHACFRIIDQSRGRC